MKLSKYIAVGLMSICSIMATAQDKITVDLWPDGAPNNNEITAAENLRDNYFVMNVSKASMSVYPSAKSNSKAIIMCPGGGYLGECITWEGHDMATWFHSLDVTYIVLKYRLPNNGHVDVPLSDVQQAILLVKKHSKEWNVNPNKIGVMGCSAGGHLAATAANLFTSKTRPDFQILLYPVITMGGYTHQGSKDALLGTQPDQTLIKKYSMELQVSDKTPRAFIALSSDDKLVPPANSINYFYSLLIHHVSATMHAYPTGGHGWGFKDKFAFKEQWTSELSKWLKTF